jgi:NitT/TauT family transport system substrate-binding protein
MADLFISYHRSNHELAKHVVSVLKSHGFSVFWDDELRAGQPISGSIGTELKDAKAVVVLWSTDSIASEWVIAEADEARKLRKLVPVCCDSCEPPVQFRGLHTRNIEPFLFHDDPACRDRFIQDVSALVCPPQLKQGSGSLLRPEAIVSVGHQGHKHRHLLLLPFYLLILALLAGLTFVISQWKPKNVRGPNELVVGMWSYPGYAPLVVAKEMGCEGLDLKIKAVKDIKEARVLLKNGTIDATVCVVDAHVHTRSQNIRTQVVLKLATSIGADGVVVRDDITSLKDLYGKRVAWVQDEPPHFLLLALAEKYLVDLKQITWANGDATEAADRFINEKDYVAAVTWEPELSRAKDKGGGRVLLSSADVPDTIVDCLSIQADYIKEKPENVRKLIRGWFRAVDMLKLDNPERKKYVETFCNFFPPMTVEEYERIAPLAPVADMNENYEFFNGENSKFRELMQSAQERWNRELIGSSHPLHVNPKDADASDIFLKLYKP